MVLEKADSGQFIYVDGVYNTRSNYGLIEVGCLFQLLGRRWNKKA